MKKIIAMICLTVILGNPLPTEAFLGGGGLKGPIAVYNKDKTVDIATLHTQINTAKQLEAALENLAKMDPRMAAANALGIQKQVQDLITMQQQIESIVNDYERFSQDWDILTSSMHGLSTRDYIRRVKELMSLTDRYAHNAMKNQAYIQSQIPSTSANLNNLLNASQSAQGALSVAQAGNQIAGIQVQQLMLLQQMMAAQNQAQIEWMRQQREKEKMAQETTRQLVGPRSTE